MKKEQENKHAEEWATPSIDVIDINKDTKMDDVGTDYDGVFPCYS